MKKDTTGTSAKSQDDDIKQKVMRYFFAILIILSAFPIASAVQKSLTNINRKTVDDDKFQEFTESGFIKILITFFSLIICAIGAMRVLGIDSYVAYSYLGVLSVAVPVALSDQIRNYISGLLLITFDRIRVSDIIMIDNEIEGKVNKIGIFSTVLVHPITKYVTYVPHSDLWSKSWVNVTKNSKVRIIVPITFESSTNFVDVKKYINGIIDEKFSMIDSNDTIFSSGKTTWGNELSVSCVIPSKFFWNYRRDLRRVIREELQKKHPDVKFVD